MTDPTRWQPARDCHIKLDYCRDKDCGGCDCGLSALRDAVAAGDPLAVLDVLGMAPWGPDEA